MSSTTQFGGYKADLGTPPPAVPTTAFTRLVAGNPNTLGTTGMPNSFAFDTVGRVQYFTSDGSTWSAIGGGGGANFLNGAGSPVGNVTPSTVGQTYLDTAAQMLWSATGLANTNWVPGGLPSGAIIKWKGSVATVPNGFHLCDGTNGTPDLRDLFVVGARQDSGGVAKTNLTGSLTQSGGSISHGHSVNDPQHSHGSGNLALAEQYTDGDVNGSVGGSGGAFGSGNADATNPAAMTGSTSAASTGITVNVAAAIQPYYALAFIMKL